MSSSHLLAAVREFTETILNPYDLEDLLQRLTDRACDITGSAGAGVMLDTENGLGFASASDHRVIDIELLQDRIESGACHEAFSTDRLIVVDDLEKSDRWPQYRERALNLGFRSVAAIPMRACGQTIGVLNLYRVTAGPWDPEDVEGAEIVTAMAAGYTLHANHLRAQVDLASQLQAAVASRDVIGQAKGRLMERHRIGAEDAFSMLRSVSQRTNMRLRDVAVTIIANDDAAAQGQDEMSLS